MRAQPFSPRDLSYNTARLSGSASQKLLLGTSGTGHTNGADFFGKPEAGPRRRFPQNINNMDNNVLNLSNRRQIVPYSVERKEIMSTYDSQSLDYSSVRSPKRNAVFL